MNKQYELKRANNAYRDKKFLLALHLYRNLLNHNVGEILESHIFFNINLTLKKLWRIDGVKVNLLDAETIDEVYKAIYDVYLQGSLELTDKLLYEASLIFINDKRLEKFKSNVLSKTKYYEYSCSELALLERVRQYNAQKFKRKAKVVVYSAIIGNYDQPIVPEYIVDDWDYVLFTDGKLFGEHIFEVRDPNIFNQDPTRIARYLKLNPSALFPDYDYSIWIDSNIIVKTDHLLNSVIKCINSKNKVMINPHPVRKTLRDELEACIKYNKDNEVVMRNQVDGYFREGFPDNINLFETNIMLRKHHENDVKLFNDIWWNEVNTKSRRDQLSLLYAIWKSNINAVAIPDVLDLRCINEVNYQLFPHVGKCNTSTPFYKSYDFYKFTPYKSDKGKYHVDIIVPVYNAFEDVKQCLNSIILHQDDLFVRVIIVNDCSDSETSIFLEDICARYENFSLITHDVNKGYTQSVNDGLKRSHANYVVTLNSDTIVTKGWLKNMIECFKSDNNIGIVGPLSNAATYQNVPYLLGDDGKFAINTLPKGVSIDDMAKIVEESSKKLFPKVPFLNGFCYMIKQELLAKIGYMDEENFPVGYGEENDFSIRAQYAGYKLVVADNVYIYHAKSKSFGSVAKDELSKKGRNSLIKKYSETYLKSKIKEMNNNSELDVIRQKISDYIGMIRR